MPVTVVVKPAERKVVISDGTVSNELFVPLEVQEVYAAVRTLNAAGYSDTGITIDKIMDWAIRLIQARRGT